MEPAISMDPNALFIDVAKVKRAAFWPHKSGLKRYI